MENRETLNLLLRYLILLLLGLFNLKIFYLVFRPLTIYPVFGVIAFFDSGAVLAGTLISFDGIQIEIIPACVAGAAYYLLLILNLSVPMNNIKRAKSLCFLFGAFLIINIARILFFTALAVKEFQYFDITHAVVWHLGSTILIVLLWFSNIWLFKIKEIPVYSDIEKIVKDIKTSKK